MDDPTLAIVAKTHNVSSAAVMLRFVSQHGIAMLSSVSKPEYIAEDVGIFDFTLTADEMAKLATLQTGPRTCPDCFTNECQVGARTGLRVYIATCIAS